MRVDGVRRAAIGVGMLLAVCIVAAPAEGQEWTAQEIVDRAVARADEQRPKPEPAGPFINSIDD